MTSVADDAIGGFNKFLEEQQKLDGKANMTLAQFDNIYEMLYNGVDIKDVKPYTKETYIPRGMTALYDAVGKTITDVHARLMKVSETERTKKVLMMILTDGHENASREYSMDSVKKLVDSRKSDGWEFVFIGAGLDKFDVTSIGTSIGVNASNTLSFDRSSRGMAVMYNSMSKMSASYRSSGDIYNH
jgi:hypothetical protein